jgi:hypothetical protein
LPSEETTPPVTKMYLIARSFVLVMCVFTGHWSG